MKQLIAIIATLALTGCATNGEFDGQKTAALIGGMLVVGYIATESADSGKSPARNCYIAVGPGGSSQVCDR